MVDLTDLIARVESASGPDRELDEAIRTALGYPPKPWNCTGSIDAALTLLPEGWHVNLLSQNYKGWSACLHRAYGSFEADHAKWKEHNSWPKKLGNEAAHDLPTPALALLSAILKARQAMEPHHDQ